MKIQSIAILLVVGEAGPAWGEGGEVEILRDRWGIPHVFAETEDRGFFGLGYACAEDRILQMDLWVRGSTHPAPLSRPRVEALASSRTVIASGGYDGPASPPERTVAEVDPGLRFIPAIPPPGEGSAEKGGPGGAERGRGAIETGRSEGLPRPSMARSAELAKPAPLLMPIPADSAMGKADPSLQRLLLSALQAGDAVEPGGWRLGAPSARSAPPGVTAKLGASSVMLAGQAEVPGAKGDFGLVRWVPGRCRMLGMWAYLAPEANVERVGFQVQDGEGESLFLLVPADWTGWRWVEADLASPEFVPSFPQAEKNKKVDPPLRSVSVAWFARQAGATHIIINALSAITDLPGGKPERALEVDLAGAAVVEPGSALADLLRVTNKTEGPVSAAVEFSVQIDGALFSRRPPDPVHGSDHALGSRSWTEADGKVLEEGSLTDGKDWTSAGTEWNRDHFEEAFQTIDLGRARRVTRLTWLSGDANWVDKVDVAASLDGATFTAVPSLQNVDLRKKWGTCIFPLSEPFQGRYLRFRYHQGGAKATVIRMPSAIEVYDGVEDESLALPEVGPMVARGAATAVVPPRGFVALPLTGQGTLETGAALVAVKLQAGDRTYLVWRNLLVLPRPWKRAGTSRLGLNAADANVHDLLERIGIGWVRFENLKWPFVSSEKGTFRFDGSIAPWHVDLDRMFESYRSHGLDILPFLFLTQDYDTPPGTSPDGGKLTLPPKDFAGYAEFAFQTAARYGSAVHPPEELKTPDKRSGLGLIRTFELWNEPNLNDPSWGHWKGPLEKYYEMFRLGAEAVKRADPKALVANGGFSGIGVELMDTLRSYTYSDGKHPLDFVDVLSVHFYTGRTMPETARINANTGTFGSTDPRTFEENLTLLLYWRDRHKPGMPVWLTETGYETGAEFGVDERTQAAWLARDVLLILASGVEKVMVFREVGSDPGRWGSAGVIRSDRSLKLSFFTYATLVREMDGIEGGALRLAAAESRLRVHAWSRGGKAVLTAWALEGTAPFPIKLGKAIVTDSFGSQRAADTAALTLTTFPVYIRDMADAGPLEQLLAEARKEEERRKAALKRQAALKAYLFDFGSMVNVGGLVIGGFRKCLPVVARDTWDEAKGYGFVPSAALQDDDQAWIGDALERDSCRLAKGIQFRFRADAGTYVLRAGVAPFEAKGRLSIGGIAGGPVSVEVAKEKGLAEIEVQVGERPLSVEMDGYAALKWLALIQKPPGDR